MGRTGAVEKDQLATEMKKSTGVIINGVYMKDWKPKDIQKLVDARAVTDKQYQQDKQRQEHAIDLIQPWVNGKPNQEFRDQFPEEAEKYYGKH